MRTPIPRSFDVPRGAEPLEAVAQCSERGLLLFDESARVIAFNRSAASLLRRFAAMSLRPLDSTADGAYRLSGADAVLPAYVEQAVADCAQRLTPGRGGGPAVPLARTLRLGARADRGALVMRLSPVGAQDGTEAAPAARVLAILGPIATHPAVDADQLRELFDLSSASARVAVAYLHVDSVKDAARALGISANTVKSHLAALYARTGCSRQSQLVRLLMRLSTPASPRRLGSVAD